MNDLYKLLYLSYLPRRTDSEMALYLVHMAHILSGGYDEITQRADFDSKYRIKD